MINKSIQIGNMVRDPELKHTQAGMAVCNFSLAINHLKDKVSYFDYTAFDKTAALIVQYCKKGNRVGIESSPMQQRWEKDGTKHSKVIFIVDRVEFLSSKESSEKAADQVQQKFSGGEDEIPY